MIRHGSMFFWFLFIIFAGTGVGAAFAGGLSGDVTRRPICEDARAQCLNKVKTDIPCKGVSESACRDKRYLAQKQCRFLYAHCIEGPPVKRIEPAGTGKKND